MVSNWSTFPAGSTTSDPFSNFHNPLPVMSTNFNLQADQCHPEIYTTKLLPNQVAVKPRQRRKKNKDKSSSGLRKRKLSEAQVSMLEKCFGEEHKLESKRKDTLALELGLDPRQVAVCFQNRRARWKCKKLEDEYSKLMNEHKTTLIQKWKLESEVLNLKGRLIEAQKEIERLLKRSSRNSPNASSLSIMEAQQPFLGEFGIDGIENNVFYVPGYDNYANGFEWYKPF